MAKNFTAHNISLPDGSLTMPDLGWTISESPWFMVETMGPRHGISERRGEEKDS